MNELLKLINEYEEEWIIFDEVDDEECFVDIHPCTLWTEYNWHLWFNNANKVQFDKWMFDKVAISKEYGFIKRLVDNDKIDFEKYRIMDTRKYLHQHIIGNVCYVDIRADVPNYEFILALLSIQDNPIEFLCDIIK